jgi:hypothetical protein
MHLPRVAVVRAWLNMLLSGGVLYQFYGTINSRALPRDESAIKFCNSARLRGDLI